MSWKRRALHRRIVTGLLGLVVLALVAAKPVSAQDGRKVVIPFDFVSKFDNGRYGKMVGEMVWKKLEREKGFIIPESMLDVRDFCQSQNLDPGPHRSLKEMKEIVRDGFDAQIGIWGSVERVAGHEWDVYDLAIKCVDFSGDEPKVVYETTARTKTVSEIPHVYVKQMLDALYNRKPGEEPMPDMIAEKNWEENPNLVAGGDFQRGTGGVPLGWEPGWEAGDVNQYERLGRTVRWLPEVGNTQNRVVRFTFGEGVGNSTGVAYYSSGFFPVEEGAKYRFQCRWRSNGPNVKVFIKCYAEMESEYGPGGAYRPARADSGRQPYNPTPAQRREVYRSQQNLKGPKNSWNLHTEDFTPKHTKYTPKWGRVMLYAYLGGGDVEFDDVVLKQILPASPGEKYQDPRHSLETKVTIKEMEENERRSQEEKDRRRRERTGRD